jgi:hypothetical protein
MSQKDRDNEKEIAEIERKGAAMRAAFEEAHDAWTANEASGGTEITISRYSFWILLYLASEELGRRNAEAKADARAN